MKLIFFILLLIVSLLSSSSFLAEAVAVTPAPAPAPIAVPCGALCGKRCANAGTQKRCLHYCNICCSKCNCVPSGTYGNKSECPCYRDMLNSKGKPKCP